MPTARELGNDHGLQCPNCKRGDELRIAATVWADLYPDGTDSSDSDTEWDETSNAECQNCNWSGKVSGLVTVELDEDEEPEAENKQAFTNHFMHCGVKWTDQWSCMCDDDCPTCRHEIEPYKSEDESGDVTYHVGTDWIPEGGWPEGCSSREN